MTSPNPSGKRDAIDEALDGLSGDKNYQIKNGQSFTLLTGIDGIFIVDLDRTTRYQTPS